MKYTNLKIKIKDKNSSEATIDAVFSTPDKDRHGDVVKQNWELENFKKNPVFLNSHRYDDAQEVIGKMSNVRVEDNKLQGRIHFAVDENPKAKVIYDPYAGGFLNTTSVGFIPKEEGENGEIERSELLEVSAVSVPSNALALAKKKGIEVEKLQKPYPNSHSCLIKDSEKFQGDSFRTKKRTHNGKEYSVIMGKLKGEDTMTEQSYRYDKKEWKNHEAKKHCEDHKGTFEPATAEKTEEEKYNCECLDCGYTFETDKHCRDVKCPKCGGETRREERLGPGQKGVINYNIHEDVIKAPKNESWNASEEVKKATGDGKKLKRMHTWVDNKNDDYDANERQWYKLPHHKGSGEQMVVWRGVTSAMAALLGARGGVDIPDKDKKEVYNHLKKHYKQFDEKAPDFKQISWDDDMIRCVFYDVKKPIDTTVIQRKPTIKAVFGEDVQSLIFPREEGWTLKSAQDWVSKVIERNDSFYDLLPYKAKHTPDEIVKDFVKSRINKRQKALKKIGRITQALSEELKVETRSQRQKKENKRIINRSIRNLLKIKKHD
ncbi:MAG: HK97 family phage prohead protease [Elusimicrobiota bacterium]